MAGNGRVRPPFEFGIGLEMFLTEAGDPDLWLEAENLAMRAWVAARRKHAAGTEPHEDGQPGPNDTG